MRLSDLFFFTINNPNADFWLIRSDSSKRVGMPVRKFNGDYIAVTVIDRNIVLPDYAFYQFEYLWNSGVFARLALGTLNLVHIRVSDIENITVIER